jgi:hypothetical protein
MTDHYHDQVADILDAASGESETLLTANEQPDDAKENLLEAADEAADLVDSMEPQELLEAVGLGTLEDGSKAETVSEAITNGDPDRVEDLQRLLRLAKLSDQSEAEELEDATGHIREAIERAQQEDEESTTDDADASENAVDSEDADDLGDRLREAMQSSFDEFGDDLGAIQEQLEAVAGDNEDGEDAADEQDDDDEDDDGLLGSEDDEDEDDGGLLGLGDGDDGSGGGLGSSDSSRHSTMAPPPSERADMKAVKRHSTMPKKNR